ncbi:MAG: hypothetical protein GY719_03720 [bacterium]|nr:hypothetical protein [bacterium]
MIVLANDRITEVADLGDPGDALWIRSDELVEATGFELKPHGACLEEICVPLLGEDKDRMLRSGTDGDWLNVSALASKLGQPIVADREKSVWSLGAIPEIRRSTLESAIAPDFEIQDRDGELICLSDFRGKKVLLVTWASW